MWELGRERGGGAENGFLALQSPKSCYFRRPEPPGTPTSHFPRPRLTAAVEIGALGGRPVSWRKARLAVGRVEARGNLVGPERAGEPPGRLGSPQRWQIAAWSQLWSCPFGTQNPRFQICGGVSRDCTQGNSARCKPTLLLTSSRVGLGPACQAKFTVMN